MTKQFSQNQLDESTLKGAIELCITGKSTDLWSGLAAFRQHLCEAEKLAQQQDLGWIALF